jgi:hypothetical protein
MAEAAMCLFMWCIFVWFIGYWCFDACHCRIECVLHAAGDGVKGLGSGPDGSIRPAYSDRYSSSVTGSIQFTTLPFSSS